jgi:hypothetical protein
VLRPVTIPDLHVGNAATHLTNLSVASIGGGHLVAYADLAPGTPPQASSNISTTWASDQTEPELPVGAPTSFTSTVTPTGLPGSAPLVLEWTVTDQNGGLIYQSPAGGESATTRTFPATGLGYTTDPCTGDRFVAVAITVRATRGLNTTVETGLAGYAYGGTPPTNPPSTCWPDPEPEPEPEPDPDPEPPICMIQPWKCPDDF